jgi:hypothetical protein
MATLQHRLSTCWRQQRCQLRLQHLLQATVILCWRLKHADSSSSSSDSSTSSCSAVRDRNMQQLQRMSCSVISARHQHSNRQLLQTAAAQQRQQQD